MSTIVLNKDKMSLRIGEGRLGKGSRLGTSGVRTEMCLF